MALYNPIFKAGNKVRWGRVSHKIRQSYGSGPFIVATVDKENVPTYESLGLGPLDAIDDPEVIRALGVKLNQHLTLKRGNEEPVLGPDQLPAVLPSSFFVKVRPRKKSVLPMAVKKRRKK